MDWFVLSLGDGMVADEPLARLEGLFDAAYSAHCPRDAALFCRRFLEGLHCEVLVYFSPGAAAIAAEVGARRCPKPPRSELVLLAGHEEAWSGS